MESCLDVSFVIPCFNEEKWIGTTVGRINEELRNINLSYEVIIVDNLSQDDSANIASLAGARVYSSAAKTVAAVRNYGFSKSCGEVIVFLDGDVHLRQGWGQALLKTIMSNRLDQKTVTGSHCAAPDNLKEPLASWYRGIENDERNTHLGTGHMIMFRVLFEQVGMFNKDLASGEDFEFCHRVVQAGGKIYNNKALEVCHMDYPITIKDFVKRECWHGTSDFTSVNSIASSKIALASLVFIALNFLSLYFLIIGSFILLAVSFGFLVVFLTLIVIKKFSYMGIKTLAFRCYAAYFYFLGRSMSIKHFIGHN